MRKTISRMLAAALVLSLLPAPAVHALTAQQAAQLLDTLYVDQVPQSVLDQPTVEDMLSALGDPYTEYFTAEEYAAFFASMSDESLVGIGILFTLTDEGMLLSEVLAGSPAEKGGLLPGDVIVTVDGHDVAGQELDDVTSWVQGEEGTTVKLRYRRNGLIRRATMTRAKVVVPATTVELVDGHIGYITCTTFGQETAQHFREGFETYGDRATVWIVDLRGNAGGITSAASDAAGYFTGEGQMAYLRDGTDEYTGYYHEDAALTPFPVIVLMDRHSASSSEIFAAAIQDHGAGIVVGTRSFGKGVAQTVLDQESFPGFFPDGDALKITSHRFFTPHGNSTDQVGVIPDVLVEPDMAESVALLLAGALPHGSTEGLLRADLVWQWYFSADAAQADPQAFQALLNALPPTAKLWKGTGGADGWREVNAELLAREYLLDYAAPRFPDHSQSSYPTALSVLKCYQLLRGKEDGQFHPQDPLTRAELCQMLFEALNCDRPQTSSPYPDVADNAWYAPAVIAMTNMGLVNGMDGGVFCPEEPVDHQQLMVILSRLATRFNLYFYDDAKAIPDGATEQEKLSEFSPWARSAVWLLGCSQKNGFGGELSLLWAPVEEIAPNDPATRDEAAFLFYRVLSYLDILPA